MCHWVSDMPYQVLTAVATRKQMLSLSTNAEWFQRYFKWEGAAVWKRTSTQSYHTRRDWRVPKVARYSFTLTHAAVCFAGEEATAIKAYKIWFKQMFSSFLFFLKKNPSLLWLFVKQHNGGFVPAIWSTVNYSWPVDAMPTTASKWITLCWRIMDIYSSGILFTIFCKKK